jgi:hypothetical protein
MQAGGGALVIAAPRAHMQTGPAALFPRSLVATRQKIRWEHLCKDGMRYQGIATYAGPKRLCSAL